MAAGDDRKIGLLRDHRGKSAEARQLIEELRDLTAGPDTQHLHRDLLTGLERAIRSTVNLVWMARKDS